MADPYQVTRDLEYELCSYTGSPFAVAVNSGTAALLLALSWWWHKKLSPHRGVVNLPRKTYVSVPCVAKLANYDIEWRDEQWRGAYELRWTHVWDCARRFTSGMYVADQFQCVSFASSKILGIEQGGAILHDNHEADKWFRKMRFDGRTEGVSAMEDHFDVIGHHCIMLPSIAAQLLLKLYHLPKHNEDLPEIEYPDLSRFDVFK